MNHMNSPHDPSCSRVSEGVEQRCLTSSADEMTNLSASESIVEEGTEYENPLASFLDIVIRIGWIVMKKDAAHVNGA